MPGCDAARHQHRDSRDRDLGLIREGSEAVARVLYEPRVQIHRARISPARIEVGGVVRFSFEIENVGRTRQELLIDYAVHFVKASGHTRAKVFKLRRLVLAAAARVNLGDSISLKPMATRRHYPGRHRGRYRGGGSDFWKP